MKMWFPPRNSTVNFNVTVALQSHSRRIREVRKSEADVAVPTDLLFAAWRQLFPAERMVVFGGQFRKRGVLITSLVDVTESNPSATHVRACPQKLAQALIDFERTGAHLAMWLHSHPGEGAQATHPSQIDIEQEKSLRQFYSARLVSLIAVRDGWMRVWGHNARRDLTRLRWQGRGLVTSTEDRNVHRLEIR